MIERYGDEYHRIHHTLAAEDDARRLVLDERWGEACFNALIYDGDVRATYHPFTREYVLWALGHSITCGELTLDCDRRALESLAEDLAIAGPAWVVEVMTPEAIGEVTISRPYPTPQEAQAAVAEAAGAMTRGRVLLTRAGHRVSSIEVIWTEPED